MLILAVSRGKYWGAFLMSGRKQMANNDDIGFYVTFGNNDS
jgi:hypothetical protein